jgi:hypothetical protein
LPDNEKVVISYKDKTLELPVVEATAGSSAMDISKLHSSLGLHTYDRDLSTQLRLNQPSPLLTVKLESCATEVTPSSSLRPRRVF